MGSFLMKYQIIFNTNNYADFTIKHDGTIVTGAVTKPVSVTYIKVEEVTGDPNHNQCFALFALIMQLHKELNMPNVVGNMSWEEIVKGAK